MERSTTSFAFNYAWSICYMLLVAINSALNPVIYIARMREFRRFVVGLGESVVGLGGPVVGSGGSVVGSGTKTETLDTSGI